jgi:hypothetical protein
MSMPDVETGQVALCPVDEGAQASYLTSAREPTRPPGRGVDGSKGQAMARNLKALCLAVFALLAVSAGMASAASAAEYHSEITNTTIKGEQVGEETLTFNAGTVKCKK